MGFRGLGLTVASLKLLYRCKSPARSPMPKRTLNQGFGFRGLRAYGFGLKARSESLWVQGSRSAQKKRVCCKI